MPRTSLPFHAPDVSQLARTLRGQLAGRERPPGHVELLNILARSAGYRNFQHFRSAAPRPAVPPPAPEAPAADERRAARLLRCFDAEGRLARWPSRRSEQVLALWVLWARIPARVEFTEREISARLAALNGFDDHAILRREMCELGLMRRTRDGRVYRRIEQPMPDEARALLRRLKLSRARRGSDVPRAEAPPELRGPALHGWSAAVGP
jgi:hypothetical protein